MRTALLSLLLASIVLWLISLRLANNAIRQRMVLIDLSKYYFGRYGAILCGLGFSISLIGWFAFQLEFISQAILKFYPDSHRILIGIVTGSLITWNVSNY